MLSQGQLIEVAIKALLHTNAICNIDLRHEYEVRFEYLHVTYRINSDNVDAYDLSGSMISGDEGVELIRNRLAVAIMNEV